ncbi:PAS domain-containing protein [Sphingomonas sp. CROZ-RG-20F-R02-07]|uniref:PAS domain-containing protein n=1 Tax=Sphingomonas sp. CROZ-RG-20F-R02-07 TaxID=2914832 RepID=UPI001F580270
MKPIEPLPLHHSWPLAESGQRFALGLVHGGSGPASVEAATTGPWTCALPDDALTWSDAVYDIFGLPRGIAVRRQEALALYAEESRAVLERLRAHAIRHRRGFTLDARIRPVTGPERWMRLIAVPACENGRTVRLHGIKQDVTALYR